MVICKQNVSCYVWINSAHCFGGLYPLKSLFLSQSLFIVPDFPAESVYAVEPLKTGRGDTLFQGGADCVNIHIVTIYIYIINSSLGVFCLQVIPLTVCHADNP